MTALSLCACLLLVIASRAQEATNTTKWSTPVAERRSGDWVPLSSPCPTCAPNDASSQSSGLVGSALPPPQNLPLPLYQQQQEQLPPSNFPLFPQQTFLQRPLSPAQQQFLQQQLLMTQLLQQANGQQQFLQHQGPLINQQLQSPQQLHAQDQNVYLQRQPNTQILQQEAPGNSDILQQTRLLQTQQVQNNPPVQQEVSKSSSLNRQIQSSVQITPTQQPNVPIQQPIPSPSTTVSTESSEEEEDEEYSDNAGKEEVQLLYVPVETLRQRGRFTQQKQTNTQYHDQAEQSKPQTHQNDQQQFLQQQQPVLQPSPTPQEVILQPQQQQPQSSPSPPPTTTAQPQRHRFQGQRRQQEQQRQQPQQYEQKPRRQQEQQRQQVQQYDQQQRLQYQEQRFQQINRQRTSTTTPNPVHQPPLSVYMDKLGHDVKLADVINTLRSTKTITVLDEVSPNSPEIFVGPSNLNTPDGYAKFEIPYLTALESNRVERKVDKLPFFVAPLSFQPPPGYSKIPFPAPHVGSVVVSNLTDKTDIHDKGSENPIVKQARGQYSLPADLPPINPELPTLVNSLQDSRQPGNVVLVPARDQFPGQVTQLQTGIPPTPNQARQNGQHSVLQQLSLSQQGHNPMQHFEISTQQPIRSTLQPVRSTQLPTRATQQTPIPTQRAVLPPQQYETLAPQEKEPSYEDDVSLQIASVPSQQSAFTRNGGFQEELGFQPQRGQQQGFERQPPSRYPTQGVQQQALDTPQSAYAGKQRGLQQASLEISTEFEGQQALPEKQQGLQQQTLQAPQSGFGGQQTQFPTHQETQPQDFETPQAGFGRPEEFPSQQGIQQELALEQPQSIATPQIGTSIHQAAVLPQQAGIQVHQTGIQTLQAGVALQQTEVPNYQTEIQLQQEPASITQEPETTTALPIQTTPSRRGQYRGRQRGTVPTYGTSTTTSTTSPPRRQHTRGRRPTHTRSRNEDTSTPVNQYYSSTQIEQSTTPVSIYQTTQINPVNPNLQSDYLGGNQFELQNDEKKLISPNIQQPTIQINLENQNVQSVQGEHITQNDPTLSNEHQTEQQAYFQYSTTTTTDIPQQVQSQADNSFQSQRFGSQTETGRRGSASRNQRLRGRGGNYQSRQRHSQQVTSTTAPTIQRRPSVIEYSDSDSTSTLRSVDSEAQQQSFAPLSTPQPDTLANIDPFSTAQQPNPIAPTYNEYTQNEQSDKILSTTESTTLYQPHDFSGQYQIPQQASNAQVLTGRAESSLSYEQQQVQQHTQNEEVQHEQQPFLLQFQEHTSTQNSPIHYQTTESAPQPIVHEDISESPFTQSPIEYSSTTEELATTLRHVPKYTSFQRTRGRTHAQKNTPSVSEDAVEENVFLPFQLPSDIATQAGSFRQIPTTRAPVTTTAADVDTPRPARTRGRTRGRQRVNHQQQESNNYPIVQTRQTPKPHELNSQNEPDQQSGSQYQSIRNSVTRQNSQAQNTEPFSHSAPQSTEDYSYLSSSETPAFSSTYEDPIQQAVEANTGSSILLSSPEESTYNLNPSIFPTTASQDIASTTEYSTTESVPIYKTGGRKQNFATRGSARRPIRPTIPPTAAAAAAVPTSSSGSNKVYTVRPPKRPQQQQAKITSVRGRIRRPTTTTTTEETGNYPTAEPAWGRQQSVRFSPSAASNEVYDSGLDDNTPTTRHSSQRHNSRGRGTSSFRRPGSDRTIQPVFISNVGQTSNVRDHSAELNNYQFGALDEEETVDSPQWTSRTPQQGVVLNFQRQTSQQSSVDKTSHSDNNQGRFAGYDAEEGAESQWPSSRLQFTNTRTRESATHNVSHTRDSSDETYGSKVKGKDIHSKDTVQFTDTEDTSQSHVTTEITPVHNVQRNLEDNSNVSSSGNISSKLEDEHGHLSIQSPSNENKTSDHNATHKVNHSRRRGGWVRVRAKQRPQDILETAESQNVATVTNILPATTVKDSETNLWALYDSIGKDQSQGNIELESDTQEEYENENTSSEIPMYTIQSFLQDDPNNSFTTKEVYFNYGDYFDEENSNNSTNFEQDTEDYSPIFTPTHTINKHDEIKPDANVNDAFDEENYIKANESSWLDYSNLLDSDQSNSSQNNLDLQTVLENTTEPNISLDPVSPHQQILNESENQSTTENIQENYEKVPSQKSGLEEAETSNITSENNTTHDINLTEEKVHTQFNANEETSSEQISLEYQKKENISTDLNSEPKLNVSDNLTSVQQLTVISNGSSAESTDLQNINKTLLDTEQTEETPSSNTNNSDESAQLNNVHDVLSEETAKISAITNINIKRMKEYQPQPSRLLGTSTSTEISHETEICYRGRCIKTKTPEINQTSIG